MPVDCSQHIVLVPQKVEAGKIQTKPGLTLILPHIKPETQSYHGTQTKKLDFY